LAATVLLVRAGRRGLGKNFRIPPDIAGVRRLSTVLMDQVARWRDSNKQQSLS